MVASLDHLLERFALNARGPPRAAPARAIWSHRRNDTVMALPPRPSANGAIKGILHVPDAERRRDRHRPEHVRRIEMPDDERGP